MKTLSRLFTAAFILFTAAACGTKEIDHPDTPDNPQTPDTPQDSEFTITASIIPTRVSFSDNDDILLPKWEVNDVLFGFYGKNTGNSILLKVVQVSDNNPYEAVLELVEDGAGLKNAQNNTPVYLIYLGENNPEPSSAGHIFNKDKLSVDLRNQNLDRIPACMSGMAYLNVGTDGKRSLSFEFHNDCAIIEIDSQTGVKDNAKFEGPRDITSISLTNLILDGSYSFDSEKGELTFAKPDNAEPEEYSIDFTNSSVTETGYKWQLTVDGEVRTSDLLKRVLVAAVPNTELNNITVTVTTDNNNIPQGYDYIFTEDFGDHQLKSGICYVVSANPYVAKTADNRYFRSVMAAFNHAKELSTETAYCTAEKNTVTLLRDYINGFKEDVAHDTEESYDPIIIQINYPVTLDLNGCTLSLDCNSNLSEWDSFYSGGFEVKSGGTLTIDDSRDSGCINSGSKKNEEGIPIITSSGTVNILGGSLSHWECGQVIDSTGGTVTMSGGKVYTWGSSAIKISGSGTTENNISGGIIGCNTGTGEALQILEGANCTISGGEFYNRGQSAVVGCRSQYTDKKSVLTVTWPTSKINGMSNQEYGEYIRQPMFYSVLSSNNGQVVPVTTSTTGLSYTNTALVYIQGGYLLTHESRFGQFYNDGEPKNDSISNLIVAESGQFYANSNVIGANNGNVHKEASTVTSFTISGPITINPSFIPDFVEDCFYEDDFGGSFPQETVLYYFE